MRWLTNKVLMVNIFYSIRVEPPPNWGSRGPSGGALEGVSDESNGDWIDVRAGDIRLLVVKLAAPGGAYTLGSVRSTDLTGPGRTLAAIVQAHEDSRAGSAAAAEDASDGTPPWVGEGSTKAANEAAAPRRGRVGAEGGGSSGRAGERERTAGRAGAGAETAVTTNELRKQGGRKIRNKAPSLEGAIKETPPGEGAVDGTDEKGGGRLLLGASNGYPFVRTNPQSRLERDYYDYDYDVYDIENVGLLTDLTYFDGEVLAKVEELIGRLHLPMSRKSAH
eukprot:1185338-Prorocentrum_minimum.AAC.3